MSEVSKLADQGYIFGNPLTGRVDQAAPVPISSDFDLEPNPWHAERFVGMDAEEILLAQVGYSVFHRPWSDKAMTKQETSPYDVDQAVYVFGVSDVVRGVKLFRRVAGEQIYGGLEPEISDDDKQTPIEEYLGLARNKQTVINKWSSHDITLHLMGALLMTEDIREKVAETADAALKSKSWGVKVDAGNAIDFLLSNIQLVWAERADPDTAEGTSHRITALMRAASNVPVPEDYSRSLAEHQLLKFREWQSQRPFVIPEHIRKADSLAIAR